ncbi:MAG: hypothetical protein MG2_0982 [uncultured Candidatus Poseidoniales archaeon]|jgi:hypothetical protein|nr:MAG: hypothetical protein MG2_0982 [uncultured Candidatus Poseidoniales archaeon]
MKQDAVARLTVHATDSKEVLSEVMEHATIKKGRAWAKCS